jgi:hypothetical protein
MSATTVSFRLAVGRIHASRFSCLIIHRWRVRLAVDLAE